MRSATLQCARTSAGREAGFFSTSLVDEETILASVRKTNHLLVVHEAWVKGGFGAEVSEMVVDKAFDYLDAPIARLGAPHTPMPYNDRLELEVIPSQERIAEVVRKLL